jgi:GcrA cell cycle regulator
MQSTNWTEAHSAALREYLANGMSYAAIAAAINAKFGTAYSRNAAIGRAMRMGLVGASRPRDLPRAPQTGKPRLHRMRERGASQSRRPMPKCEVAEPATLRCAEIDPRHLSLLDLAPGDCRYPYGGDAEGEAITFCGHPQHMGSSYCIAHFDLTRGPGTASERAAEVFALRLVEAA